MEMWTIELAPARQLYEEQQRSSQPMHLRTKFDGDGVGKTISGGGGHTKHEGEGADVRVWGGDGPSKYENEGAGVNWTEYLLLVAPPTTHSYILLNPGVAVPSDEYMEQLNQVLNETSPRTITNYVMVQYILSWLPLLEKKYSNLLNWFASVTDSSIHPRNRSETCFTETQKHFKVAMLAMYARSRPTEFLRPLVEDMVMGIIEGLREEIRENEWMDKEFKKVVVALHSIGRREARMVLVLGPLDGRLLGCTGYYIEKWVHKCSVWPQTQAESVPIDHSIVEYFQHQDGY
ncbi:hypothetical protein TELCIR_06860 [Teladorsagia circumcincta]|uniref:Peptidase M13 N-terminal domain-containing protein n=1 Tax=Teladorsagia circumcincta TaxID=45464 RepID=A0A2G9ULW4_TELCI|nr:hypothetical protein TELCIR_06860 [Teladorsagia circumcincta]